MGQFERLLLHCSTDYSVSRFDSSIATGVNASNMAPQFAGIVSCADLYISSAGAK